jgi:DNA-binding transcriptional ArsR family regulator
MKKNAKKITGKKSALLPIFRSESQALILAALLLQEKEFTLSEIVESTGVSRSKVEREIERLQESNLISSRYLGRNRLIKISVNEPLRGILYQLMLHTYGPKEILAKHYKNVQGIEFLYIYGSWAARYNNIPGAQPNDIDLLVIGNPDPQEVNEIADAVALILKKEVNPHIAKPESWSNPQGDFLKGLKDGPLVPLI